MVEVKMRFDGCTMMDVEFDDGKYTGSHYGHLCRAQVRLDTVTILDEREGGQNEAIKAARSMGFQPMNSWENVLLLARYVDAPRI